MKQMVFGVLSGGIVILFVVMLLTMQHKNVRKEELEQSLTEAMETTLQMVQRLYFRRYEDITDSKSGSADEFRFRINRSDACSRCRKRITFCGSGRAFFLSGWENGQYKVLPYNSYR